jgi:hypothetical protein
VDRITRGRIIWLDVTDPQGIPVGDHAAVILTTKAESESGEPLKAVVISSKLQHAAKERIVELPWSRGDTREQAFPSEVQPCAIGS